MVCWNKTYRDMQDLAGSPSLPWDEPIPDHSTIGKFMQKIPHKWLEAIVDETARMCLAGHDPSTLMLAANSTRVVTDRNDKRRKKDLKPKTAKKAERIRKSKSYKKYIKWHVAAVTGLQVIVACRITSDKMADTTILEDLLRGIKRTGIRFSGIFNADKWYDSDRNVRLVIEAGMKPNIKQRSNAVNTKTKYRKKAAKMLDSEAYKMRSLIECVFGAEERGPQADVPV